MTASIPICVVGASAGGVEATARLVAALPVDFPGAVFVAMHFPAFSTSVLPRILERAGCLPAAHPEEGDAIKAGRIYVAPPDRHLLVLRRKVHLVRGPKENGNRPAIDPMFRSAAVSHGASTVGVLLTGNLDDGTAGLIAIKRHGGITMAQDPAEAPFPSMPQSAIEHARVDFVLPIAQLGTKLTDLARWIQSRNAELPEEHMDDDAVRETLYAELDLRTVEQVDEHPGRPSQFGCRDCGGVLWEIEDGDLVRYRCRVGHAWSADALLQSQAEQLDQALWVALRALEENATLTEGMAQRARKRGNDVMAARYERESRNARRRAQVIKGALLQGLRPVTPPTDADAQRTG
jgi:two-component system chemotaxis response regulator CheB